MQRGVGPFGRLSPPRLFGVVVEDAVFAFVAATLRLEPAERLVAVVVEDAVFAFVLAECQP